MFVRSASHKGYPEHIELLYINKEKASVPKQKNDFNRHRKREYLSSLLPRGRRDRHLEHLSSLCAQRTVGALQLFVEQTGASAAQRAQGDSDDSSSVHPVTRPAPPRCERQALSLGPRERVTQPGSRGPPHGTCRLLQAFPS